MLPAAAAAASGSSDVAASYFHLSRNSTTGGDGKVRDTKGETGGKVEGKGAGWRGAENKTDSVRRGGGVKEKKKKPETIEFRDVHV